MSGELAGIFAGILSSLTNLLRSDWAWPSVESGFAWYLFHSSHENGPVPDTSTAIWPSAEPLHRGQSLASAGYMLEISSNSVTDSQRSAWVAGLERLSQKDAFPLDRQSFAYRPLQMLGIALGISKCAAVQEQHRIWFRTVLERAAKESSSDLWTQSILAVAAAKAGSTVRFSAAVPPADDVALAELALLRWTVKTLGSSQPSLATQQIPLLDSMLLKRVSTEAIPAPDVAQAATLFLSLRSAINERIDSAIAETWQVGRQEQDAVKLIENLCRRFHLFAMQLQHRRQQRNTLVINDEYDVQDAMHAVLRLHFDDVRDEEVSPSYAGNSARIDFILKRGANRRRDKDDEEEP